MAPVIQSFKKVINVAPASRLSSTDIENNMSVGTDSVAAGQVGPIDAAVPTGSVIKYFEIQWAMGNLSGGSLFMHVAIQLIHQGQVIVSPNVVGGNAQRNQVFFQTFFQIGTEQNGSRIFRFKVPKKFQRVREGDVWKFVRQGSEVYADGLQIIYKFYR